jgi:hypothetical protein
LFFIFFSLFQIFNLKYEDLTDQDVTIIENAENETNKSDNTDNDVFEEDLHISEESPSPGSRIDTTDAYLRQKPTPNLTVPRTNPKRTQIPINISGAKPKFLKLFDSVKIKEGAALMLTCQVSGEPMPELYW